MPELLIQLASSDHTAAMKASHHLWCCLCHQHAYVSSAALPALPFLLEILDEANEQLTVEILDILTGFAVCSRDDIPTSEDWTRELHARLIEERHRFTRLADHPNSDIADWGRGLLDELSARGQPEDTVNDGARFVVPAALLAQLRERRAQKRARWQGGAPATRTPSLIETFKQLVDSPAPNTKEAAAAFVDGMDALQSEVEDQEDAFLLDPGMGPMTYLTTDGRVLEDHRSWDGGGLREATLDDAIAALVVGAMKTGITELLSLVPACPEDGSRCPRCEGERWDKRLREHGLEIICGICRGRGWMTPAMLEAAKARGATM